MPPGSSFAATQGPEVAEQTGRHSSQDRQEISSDKEDRRKARKKSKPHLGVLRGIDPNNILASTATQHTIEIDDRDDETASKPNQGHKYKTRAAQHGRRADTFDKYDMKFHPADAQLRPKTAAKRRSGSRSMSVSTFHDEDEDTEEESAPSLLRDSDSDQASEDDDSVLDHPAIAREPNGRASRRSTRKEAHKYVNYSVKYHPNDVNIPGYQHKARQVKQPAAIASSDDTVKRKRKAVKCHKAKRSNVLPSSQSSDEVDNIVEETLLNLSQYPTSSARESAKSSTEEHVVFGGQIDASNDSTGALSSDQEIPRAGSSLQSKMLREKTQLADGHNHIQLPSSPPKASGDFNSITRNSDLHGSTSRPREGAQTMAQDALNSTLDEDLLPSGSTGDSNDNLERNENLSSPESTTLRDEIKEAAERRESDSIETSQQNKVLDEIETPGETEMSDETELPHVINGVDNSEQLEEPREAGVQPVLSQGVASKQRAVANSSSSDMLI